MPQVAGNVPQGQVLPGCTQKQPPALSVNEGWKHVSVDGFKLGGVDRGGTGRPAAPARGRAVVQDYPINCTFY